MSGHAQHVCVARGLMVVGFVAVEHKITLRTACTTMHFFHTME